MNFLKLSYKLAIIVALVFGATSCNDKATASNNSSNSAASSGNAMEKMNIRYIDEDSVMKNYNLAKDLNEAMLRRQNQLDAAQKQRESEIQKFQSAMESKYKNNGYTSESQFNADQAKLQKMTQDAQNYLGGLQQSGLNEAQQSQIQISDSIKNFMDQYAKQKGYDMILLKSATVFIDEKYDVTGEVIEGLNKRYVKVEKK